LATGVGTYLAPPLESRRPRRENYDVVAERHTANAYCYAATFRLRELAPCFAGADIEVTKTELNATFGAGRWAVVFDFGAIAFLGVDAPARRAILSGIERAVGPEPHPPLEEEIDLLVDPDAPEAASFDRVALKRLDVRTFQIVALLLAQSVSLDYYEEDVRETIARIDVLAQELERRGGLRRPEREMVQLVGASILSKDQIIASLALLDKPGATWEDERLDRLYLALRNVLEIPERYAALEKKLRSIQENLELFIDLVRHRRSVRLEVVVAVLIAVELAVLLYQVVMPLR
jgi:uncharacterized Rmd1/YagE family protein